MAKLLFIGCGKMGGAILSGNMGNSNEIIVVEPHPVPAIKAASGILLVSAPNEIPASFAPDVIIVAIKPQNMAEILPLYSRYGNSTFLSIAAGKTIGYISALLGNKKHSVVRAMPNLPASIGMGISVAVANPSVTAGQRVLCDQVLRAAGEVEWVDDESLIDPVTALSGSGPAYIFALIEAMAEVGEKLGLPPELSQKLARHTVIGSGALLKIAPESASELRQAVTSPGGTTAAALAHLLGENGLFPLLSTAMAAAVKRAKELAS